MLKAKASQSPNISQAISALQSASQTMRTMASQGTTGPTDQTPKRIAEFDEIAGLIEQAADTLAQNGDTLSPLNQALQLTTDFYNYPNRMGAWEQEALSVLKNLNTAKSLLGTKKASIKNAALNIDVKGLVDQAINKIFTANAYLDDSKVNQISDQINALGSKLELVKSQPNTESTLYHLGAAINQLDPLIQWVVKSLAVYEQPEKQPFMINAQNSLLAAAGVLDNLFQELQSAPKISCLQMSRKFLQSLS